MYADNARNRILMVLTSFVVMVSLSFNVRQSLDVQQYQTIVSETQEVLKNVAQATVMPSLGSIRTVPVNATELQCMARNIYFEAATQSLVGKIAVGQVVLNRMTNPNYPKTVCGVVNQRVGNTCQFSWTCEDGKEVKNSGAWKQSQQVAYDLLSRDRKDMVDITEGATHFHRLGLKPGWKLKPVTKIDDHMFYK
jgi:spore germination cell wall hydrolase CwlJ-like protein